MSGKSNIQVLVESGADAMSNMFMCKFTFPDGDTGGADLVWRLTGVDIPEPKVETYDVTYLGVKYKKTKSGISMERTLDLEFKLDATYVLYEKFLRWQRAKIDVNNGGMGNTTPSLGTVEVYAMHGPITSASFEGGNYLNEDGTFNSAMEDECVKWSFYDVSVVDVGQPKFKNDASGNAITYKVKFIFGRCKYPGYDSTIATPPTHSLDGANDELEGKSNVTPTPSPITP